jgi:hypothetical protein
MERHEDGDVYQEVEGYQSFTISDRVGLKELATGDIGLLEEAPCPSKKCIQKSKCLIKRQDRCE